MLSQSIPSGFLLIEKPAGITSHDVIDQLRRVTGVQRIGHSGTLDPFATGLLIVGIGREATREIDRFLKMDKQYRATLYLGATSDTGDKTGTIISNLGPSQYSPTENIIQEVLKRFTGDISQVPPMHSAKKVGGKKLYELARRGKTIERRPVSISISNLALVSYTPPLLTIDIACSSGTYIRTLSEDIGNALGCGAYCQELQRTAIGPYRLKDAMELDMITTENWEQRLK
ncbi:tRNA pseudouridine(55) synthase TruB [Candidatus Uhrbacteria bacterium]|nr:tRNA pseudouridine(55) synthase TruB [Candidatus Uhrbacteria bacterium]